MVPVPQRAQQRGTGWSTWWLQMVLVLGLVATACGGVSDLIDDQLASQLEAESSDDGSAGFAGPGYAGDARSPMESLAAAVVDALLTMDIIAASGDAGDALTPPDSIDLPEGIPTQANLIDELSAVPLPEGTVIGFGDVYSDRASQDAFSDLSVGDTARFYLEAHSAAGFEITSGGPILTDEDVLELASQSISFLDPDGNRGDIIIREGAFSPTQLGIQIFLP